MSTIQAVIDKAKAVVKIARDYVSQATSILVGTASEKADLLTLEEMSRRLDIAVRALRGEDVSTSAGVTTAQKTSLQIAKEMVESYAFDKKTGVSTFTVPAGVTDVEAMKALNQYFRKNHSKFNRDAVYAGDLDWYESLQTHPDCQERDYSQARQITITGVVKGTYGWDRTTQGGVLKDHSLVFSDPRDQALAAAIHACKHNGADLFQVLRVRGSVSWFALCTVRSLGVRVRRYHGGYDPLVAASGSPSLELKKT
jgi:hypothetical protein